ncbi:putative phosphatidylinositol-3-phosphatase myotubularin-1 [Sesbania bispinosa]|nr:putative phosphatidylinositol-3-phosphatase myotubularin-1 [Sesbania bispinosa]
MESLNAELRHEKQLNSSATNMAKRISKENIAIKCAIQSIGCKVHFSSSGDCIVDIETNPADATPNFIVKQKKPLNDAEDEEDARKKKKWGL